MKNAQKKNTVGAIDFSITPTVFQCSWWFSGYAGIRLWRLCYVSIFRILSNQFHRTIPVILQVVTLANGDCGSDMIFAAMQPNHEKIAKPCPLNPHHDPWR
jgi:hypothetical protein